MDVADVDIKTRLPLSLPIVVALDLIDVRQALGVVDVKETFPETLRVVTTLQTLDIAHEI